MYKYNFANITDVWFVPQFMNLRPVVTSAVGWGNPNDRSLAHPFEVILTQGENSPILAKKLV